jgi:hypothetical protein
MQDSSPSLGTAACSTLASAELNFSLMRLCQILLQWDKIVLVALVALVALFLKATLFFNTKARRVNFSVLRFSDMIFGFPSFVLLSTLSVCAVAQSTSTPLFDPTTMCQPGSNVQLTNCNNYYNQLDNCTVQPDTASLVSCMCTQPFFNLIVKPRDRPSDGLFASDADGRPK